MRNYKKLAAITMCVSVFGIGSYMAVSGIDSALNTAAIQSHASEDQDDNNQAENNQSDSGNASANDSVKSGILDMNNNEVSDSKVSLANDIAADQSGHTDVSDVAEAVMPSIVAINIEQTVRTNYYGRVYEQEAKGSGSGVIIKDEDDKLLIVTNNHVVESADSLNVEFADGESTEGRVRGTDASSDLAVVEVSKSDLKQSTLDSIAVIRVGNSDEIKVGEMVVAIGNALGYGQSVTVGYVSAKDRKIEDSENDMPLIQTDAAINPGNSGGALVNLKGELIGINSSKLASAEIEGMCFAIPVTKAGDTIKKLAAEEVQTDVAKPDRDNNGSPKDLPDGSNDHNDNGQRNFGSIIDEILGNIW